MNIRRRSILLGLLLIPFNCFYVILLERALYGPYPSTISLFANAIFVLFALCGFNSTARRRFPRAVLTSGDLIVVYTMLAISTGLAGLDGVATLNQLIPHGAWFGPANDWKRFLGVFPRWLVVSDREILTGHFLGHSSFFREAVLRAWMTPIAAWTAFVTALLFVGNCVNVLVRKQWADRERLTFPIVWLPLAMADGGGTAFFANRMMWTGFALAASLNLWNGLAFLYPSIPSLPLGITDFKPFLTTKPWVGIDWLPITFYPMVIGLGFILPLDLLFSCWFFYLFWKVQMVLTNTFGWDVTPDFPFIKEQGFGSIMGLFLFYLWSGRRAYRGLWQSREPAAAKLAGGTRQPDEVPEALSGRSALAGMAIGTAALLVFYMAAGVTWWVAALFFGIYIPTIIVVTRIRAELGPPVHDFHFMGPDNLIPRVMGTGPLRTADLAFFTFAFAFTRAHRGDVMPVGLEGLQMARLRKLGARRMFAAIMLAVSIGTLSTLVTFEQQAYRFGTATRFNQGFGMSQEAFARIASWTSGGLHAHPNPMAITAIAVGLATTAVLFSFRLRSFGFPFHPIGYAISSSWAINLVWMPLLIAWVLKGLTMRYGGLAAYRRFLPFFLGLILGDCVVGTFWGLVSLAFNVRTYNFFGA